MRGNNSDIFSGISSGKRRLKPHVKFHFFCSHVPCGDASIIPMLKRKIGFETSPIKMKKFKSNDDSGESQSEGIVEIAGHLVEDIHRTGGKCVGAEDPKGPGTLYHKIGVVRTKPGRGERTLSLSCSDKIAKWIYCGIQGALLSILIEDKLLLESITIGGGSQFSIESMERALTARSESKHRPSIKQSNIMFEHSRYSPGRESNPCSTSIIWVDVRKTPIEISVEGKKLGTTKKTPEHKSRLKISKIELFKDFINLTGEKYKGMEYKDVKSLAETYNNDFNHFKKNIGSWSNKPSLQGFTFDA